MSAGLGGFLGLDPSLALNNPMQALAAQAENQQGGNPAPMPAPDPQTTGAIPVAAPAAPAPAPAPSGGGVGGFLGSLFGGGASQPGDDKVDPNTGATVGQTRQMNIQGLQKVGLLLLAAGQRMSSDARASILAKAPDALDNSAQLNSFAKMRLEMANARLAERKQAQTERQDAYFQSLFGGSGAAAASAAGVAVPTVAAPAAPGVAGATPAPDGTSVAPAATGAPAAPAMAGAPAAAAPSTGAGITAGMTPGEIAAVRGMGTEKGLEYLAKRRGELDSQETYGKPFIDPDTGDKMAPVMKGGQQIRVQSVGHLTPQMTEETDANGQTRRVTRLGGQVTNIQDVAEDPQDREERTASVGLRKQRYDALTKSRPDAENAATSYDRVSAAQEAVTQGKTLAGLGANPKEQAMNFMASIGILSPEGRAKLVQTNDVNAILSQSGGEFAKQYYGPQISNSDVENAKKAVGAIMSNSPDQVAAALGRIKEGYRRQVETFDRDAKSHNDRLSGIRSEGLRADLQVSPIGKDFSAPQQSAQPAPQPSPRQAAPQQQQWTDAQKSAAAAELARRRAAQQGAR